MEGSLPSFSLKYLPTPYPLLLTLAAQTIAYGYLFDVTFFVRNLAVIGGLLIILAHEKVRIACCACAA